MKVIITPEQQPAFVKGLKKVDSVTKSRSTLPVLAAVLVTADEKGLLLQSTNLDQSFEIRVDAEVKEKGQCGVSASDLSRIASLSTEVKMQTEENHHLSVKGAGTFRLPLFAATDFPPFPAVGKENVSTLGAAEIRRLLRVSHAMSPASDHRYVLQGICYNSESRETAACNGSSLALSTSTPAKEGWSAIIPDIACRILSTLVAEDGEYSVALSATSASFESGGVIFHTRLIEGTFPNFHAVLRPSDFSVRVDRKALFEAINRACVAQADTQRIEMSVEGSTATFTVHGKNADSSVTLDLLSPLKKLKEFKVAFNSSFLSDAAKAMEDETISLEFTDELSPLMVRGDGYAIIQIMRTE
jgi:DNA polymerase III subunit beta